MLKNSLALVLQQHLLPKPLPYQVAETGLRPFFSSLGESASATGAETEGEKDHERLASGRAAFRAAAAAAALVAGRVCACVRSSAAVRRSAARIGRAQTHARTVAGVAHR